MRELNFNRLGWGDNEVVQLALVLPLCAKLVKLTLEANKIGAVGAAALAKFLVVNGSLTSISLDGNRLDAEAGKALAPAVASSSSLTTLR